MASLELGKVSPEFPEFPGLPRAPAAEAIHINDKGEIEGLF